MQGALQFVVGQLGFLTYCVTKQKIQTDPQPSSSREGGFYTGCEGGQSLRRVLRLLELFACRTEASLEVLTGRSWYFLCP